MDKAERLRGGDPGTGVAVAVNASVSFCRWPFFFGTSGPFGRLEFPLPEVLGPFAEIKAGGRVIVIVPVRIRIGIWGIRVVAVRGIIVKRSNKTVIIGIVRTVVIQRVVIGASAQQQHNHREKKGDGDKFFHLFIRPLYNAALSPTSDYI